MACTERNGGAVASAGKPNPSIPLMTSKTAPPPGAMVAPHPDRGWKGRQIWSRGVDLVYPLARSLLQPNALAVKAEHKLPGAHHAPDFCWAAHPRTLLFRQGSRSTPWEPCLCQWPLSRRLTVLGKACSRTERPSASEATAWWPGTSTIAGSGSRTWRPSTPASCSSCSLTSPPHGRTRCDSVWWCPC